MKRLFPVLLLALAVLGGGLAFLAFRLDQMVRSAVLSYGPRLTGTAVSLSSVNLSPLAGRVGVSGLALGRPEGFRADPMVAVGRLELEIAPASLLGDYLEIRTLRIIDPALTYEYSLRGSNFDRLLQNIQAATGASSPTTPDRDPAPVRKIMVHEFLLTGAQVSLAARDRSIAVPVPTLTLRNLGTDSGGLAPAELSRQILAQILPQITASLVAQFGSEALRSPSHLLDLGGAVLNQTGGLLGGLKGLLGGEETKPPPQP